LLRCGENLCGSTGPRRKYGRLELRSILLLAAVVVFIVAIFVDQNALKWIAAGLALFAAAFLISETGIGRSLGRRRL